MEPSTRGRAVVGAVLAGGASRRMGADKRAVTVDGTTLLDRSLAAVRVVAGRACIVGTGGGVPVDREVPVVADLRPGAGPLAGLETALTALDDDEVLLIVGVDHPWLDPGVLGLLVDRLRAAPPHVHAAMLRTARGPQPLLAAYRPSALPLVAGALDAGERRLGAVVDHLDVEVVDLADWRVLDPAGATAVDVDTPDDLARALRWQDRRSATAPRPPLRDDLDLVTVPVTHVGREGAARRHDDTVIAEEPLEILAAGPDQDPVPLVTTLRTPGHERDLAAGWVVAESLAAPGDVRAATTGDPVALSRPDDRVVVHLDVSVDPQAAAHRRAVATAACGVCGRASITELAERTAPVTGDAFGRTPLPWPLLAGLPDELRLAQRRFDVTGGVHATGLFDADGRLVTLREDVGRHNALDAAIGAHVLAGDWPSGGLDDLVCVLSGRVGFELVAKAAVARLPVVVAVGAPTDLAIRTAERLHVTLVGFVRGGAGNVYTHPHRIALADAGDPGGR